MLFRKKTPFTRSEVERMRAALQWYANEHNWRRHGVHKKGDPVKWVKSAAAVDRGALARAALKKSWSARLWDSIPRIACFMSGPSDMVVMPAPDNEVTLSLVPILDELEPGARREVPAPMPLVSVNPNLHMHVTVPAPLASGGSSEAE